MSAPQSPPPGSVPSGLSPDSPDNADLQAMMKQMQGSSTSSANASKTSKTSKTTANASSSAALSDISILKEPQNMAKDIGQGMLSLLPDIVRETLHLKDTDSPEVKAKKQKMLANFQKQSKEDQEKIASEMRARQEQAKKKQQEEQEARRQQQIQEEKKNDLPVITGKQHGAGANQPGQSRKSSMMDTLKKKRQQMNDPV